MFNGTDDYVKIPRRNCMVKVVKVSIRQVGVESCFSSSNLTGQVGNF